MTVNRPGRILTASNIHDYTAHTYLIQPSTIIDACGISKDKRCPQIQYSSCTITSSEIDRVAAVPDGTHTLPWVHTSWWFKTVHLICLSVVCPTFNTGGLMGDKEGNWQFLMEQAPIPGVQSYVPSPYISVTYLPVWPMCDREIFGCDNPD